MQRSLVTAITMALLLLMAIPASAQYGAPGPAPLPGPGNPPLTPAGTDDELPGGTTPCSTILISGTQWGPGTQVTIVRNDPGDPGAEDAAGNTSGRTCANQNTTVTGLTGTAAAAGANAAAQPEAAAAAEAGPAAAAQAEPAAGAFADAGSIGTQSAASSTLAVVTVAEDGTFEIPVQVPADATGSFAYVIQGTGTNGLTREVPAAIDVQLLDSFADGQTGGLLIGQILIVALIGVVIVAQFIGGGSFLRRRRNTNE